MDFLKFNTWGGKIETIHILMSDFHTFSNTPKISHKHTITEVDPPC